MIDIYNSQNLRSASGSLLAWTMMNKLLDKDGIIIKGILTFGSIYQVKIGRHIVEKPSPDIPLRNDAIKNISIMMIEAWKSMYHILAG